MRIRANIDLSTSPWFGTGLQHTTLNRLINRLGDDQIKDVRFQILQVLNRHDLVMEGFRCNGNLGTFFSGVIRHWTETTQEYGKHGTWIMTSRDPMIEGVLLKDLLNKPIAEAGPPPTILTMLSIHRAIVEGKNGPYPGLESSISMAGIYGILLKMGVEITESA